MVNYFDMQQLDEAVGNVTGSMMLPRARKRLSAGDAVTQNVTPGEALPNAIGRLRERAAEAYKQGSELFNQEPDYSQLQAFAKQRAEQGDRAMLGALAAQFAGPQFESVQAQMLKKASASRDPLKVGSGYITAEGGFVKDPEVMQQRQAEFLLSQAKNYESMAQNAESVAERMAAQRAQRDIENQLRLMGLNIQQQGVDIRAARAAAGGGTKAPSGYRYTPDGSLEAIPGGPADLKAQAENQRKAEGGVDLDVALSTLRDAYNRLDKGGGITSTNKGSLANVGAAISSSAPGQVLGKALGTSNQSARNDVAMARPALLAALMKSTGMSAKQMDSNAELKLWLATATDPTLDVEANRRALDNIERKYLAGRGVAPSQAAPASAPAKAGGLSPAEQAELEALRKRFGGK